MRLLYLTARYPFTRAEAFLTDEILDMARNTEMFIVPLRAGGKHTVHAVGMAKAIREPLLSLSILTAIIRQLASPLKVVRVLKRLLDADARPKSITRNLAVVPKSLWVASLVRRLGIDHIHAHWASLPSSVAWIASQLTGVPWSFTAHRYDIDEANAISLKLSSAAFARAISDRGRRLLQSYRQTPVVVLHMGVAIPRERASLSPVDLLRIIVPANLVAVKGHTYLLQGLAECRQRGLRFRCTIAGDGPLRASLDRAIDSLGLRDSVEMAGSLNHEMLLRRYKDEEVDVVMLTSIPLSSGEQEGIPVALIEAMSYGIPVVGTRCGAISELVAGCGILIPPKSVSAIADALVMLNDPQVRSSLGAKGRQRVEEEYDVTKIAYKLRQLMAVAGRPRMN